MGYEIDIISFLQQYEYIIKLTIVIVTSFLILSIILRSIKKFLLKKVKSKQQLSNVSVFLDLLKYVFALFFIIIVVFSYYNNWGEIGFVAGLLTVALGWALQKPISGIFAWLILITSRPFRIGDRIIICDIIGEVSDITLTHIFLEEIGGTIEGEEKSGRTIIVPTSIIFEREVTNFTERDNYILDDVTAAITYESNIDNAEKIMISSVKKIMKPFWEKIPKKTYKEPITRLKFNDSGVNVTIRYLTLTELRNKISTDITREIHKNIIKSKDVKFAYPHAEVLLKQK